MQYSESELMELPMNILTNVDIRNKSEEDLVQSVINKKRLQEPQPLSPLSFRSSETDNMTIEKERELQTEIDARNETMRKELESREVPETEVEPIVEPDEKVLVSEPVTDAVVEQEVKRFCEFCTSKGVKHLKICTRNTQ